MLDLIVRGGLVVTPQGASIADVAVAGGKDPSKLDEALTQARAAAGVA